MAVPKRKTSKSRRNKRRSHHRINNINIIEDNKYRKDIWRASHLRSFKTHVWNKIDIEDLKDSTTGLGS